jgi:hypothetical protein
MEYSSSVYVGAIINYGAFYNYRQIHKPLIHLIFLGYGQKRFGQSPL